MKSLENIIFSHFLSQFSEKFDVGHFGKSLFDFFDIVLDFWHDFRPKKGWVFYNLE